MSEVKQRGSGWSVKLVFNLYRLFGYKFIYYLMYPVTFFYFLFAQNVKDSLRGYYKNLGLEFNNRVYYTHLRLFAICLMDRFISKVAPKEYRFHIPKQEELESYLDSGVILLNSHFGGWAASSNGAKTDNRLNIVMREALLGSITDVEQSIEGKSSTNIIDLSSGLITVSLEVANALLKNEIVAIMGDRAASKKTEIPYSFLGKTGYFNKIPFQIAYKTNKPIVVFFSILVGMQQYKVEFMPLFLDRDLKEQEAVEKAVGEYVKKLEETVKEYPQQWFNFYNFWESR